MLFAATVVALPLTAGGCGREACFTWTQAEGACPAQAEALSFFSSPECPGNVIAVESEGVSERDGALCCYAVMERDTADDPSCLGAGGARSSSAVGQGVGGSSAFAVSVTVGSGGSVSECVHCFDGLGASPVPPCPGTAALVDALLKCACGGPCSAACADTFCKINPTSDACAACLEDPTLGCGNEFTTCANDI